MNIRSKVICKSCVYCVFIFDKSKYVYLEGDERSIYDYRNLEILFHAKFYYINNTLNFINIGSLFVV